MSRYGLFVALSALLLLLTPATRVAAQASPPDTPSMVGWSLEIPASVFEGVELVKEPPVSARSAPAPQAERGRDGWFKRNWKWFVPVVAAAVVTAVVIAVDDNHDRDRDRDRICDGSC